MGDKKENVEEDRLEELRSYEILDTVHENIFDQITSLASAMCGTPISLVSFVDSDRQWFKSAHGLEATETPRSVSFCSHAILQDDVMEVKDSLLDERFKNNPLVLEAPHIRFYAGAPLITPTGHRLGTLCVIDWKPKELTKDQKLGLKILAGQVVDQLVLKKLNKELTEAKSALERQQEILIKNARMQSIGEMASSICHQINNPMTIIAGKSMVLKTLLRDVVDERGPQILKEIDGIDQTALRVSEIIKTLRDFTKDMGSESVICTMSELIYDALVLMKGEMLVNSIALSQEVLANPTVKVNKNQVAQVILNLLSNCIDALKDTPKKTISLKLWSDEQFAFLDIADNGCGVKEGDEKRIFDALYSTKARHLGIGLSSAANLIENQNGEIIYLNSHPTVFRIKLPKSA